MSALLSHHRTLKDSNRWKIGNICTQLDYSDVSLYTTLSVSMINVQWQAGETRLVTTLTSGSTEFLYHQMISYQVSHQVISTSSTRVLQSLGTALGIQCPILGTYIHRDTYTIYICTDISKYANIYMIHVSIHNICTNTRQFIHYIDINPLTPCPM